MLANGAELYKFLDGLFYPHGFVRKKDTWYLNSNECIVFFHTSKSPFSGHYDHVMGCFYKKVYTDSNNFPKYYKSNLKQGIDNFVEKKKVKMALDMEDNSFKGQEREELLKNLVEVYVIPFLIEISTEEGIRKAVEKKPTLKHYMDAETKDALSISEDD